MFLAARNEAVPLRRLEHQTHDSALPIHCCVCKVLVSLQRFEPRFNLQRLNTQSDAPPPPWQDVPLQVLRGVILGCLADLQRNYRNAIVLGSDAQTQIKQNHWFVQVDVKRTFGNQK